MNFDDLPAFDTLFTGHAGACRWTGLQRGESVDRLRGTGRDERASWRTVERYDCCWLPKELVSLCPGILDDCFHTGGLETDRWWFGTG